MTVALEFPPISHLVEWTDIAADDSLFAINKIVLLYMAAAIATVLFFGLGGRRKALVPAGAQNRPNTMATLAHMSSTTLLTSKGVPSNRIPFHSRSSSMGGKCRAEMIGVVIRAAPPA